MHACRSTLEDPTSLSGSDEDDPETLITLGQFYFEAGEFGRAVPILERYVATQSLPSANALFLLARAQIQLERFVDAERVLRQTLLQAPESLQVLEALVDVLRLQEKYEDTVPLLQRTLEMQGGDATVYTRLGEAHYRAGRFKEAGDTFEMATREDPRSTTALYYLSLSLEKQARQAEARLALQKILLIEPNNPEVLFRLARIDERQGEYGEAVTHYRQLVRSIAQSGDAEARRDLPTFCGRIGVLLLEMKRYDEAVDELIACRGAEGPTEPLLQHLLVRALVFAGRPGPALEEAARARARFPDDPRFEILEAEVMLQTGRRKEGEDKLDAVLARAPRSERTAPPSAATGEGEDEQDAPLHVMVSDAYFNAGTHAERNGDSGRAEDLLRRALAIHPDNAPALNYLGYIWADAGRNLEEALEFLKRAVAIDPDNAAYLDSLGWAYFRLGRLGPARDNLQKAVRLLPADPTMHEHLGDVEAADGKTEAAVQSWRQALKQGAESPERVREKIRNAGGDVPHASKAR